MVTLDPVRGSELRKTRPAVIVSRQDLGTLPVQLAVPITAWSGEYARKVWIVRLTPTQENGLAKDSAADTFQARCLSNERFTRKLGEVTDSELESIIRAFQIVIGA